MRVYSKGKVNLYLGDNMEFMAKVPNNYYDLAVVDPPYGIGMMSANNLSRGKKTRAKNYKKINDSKPSSPNYFDELKRVSKNQI